MGDIKDDISNIKQIANLDVFSKINTEKNTFDEKKIYGLPPIIEEDEYLVEGALLRCSQGNLTVPLKIPYGHSVNSAGKKEANCKDCKTYINIFSFGICQKNTKNHMCRDFMKLDPKWINTKVDVIYGEKVDGEDAISLHSLILCKKGGIIIPVTSGQGEYLEENIFEFLERKLLLHSWAKGNIPEYVLFGADPVNLCTGNFVYEKEDILVPGSVVLSFRRFYNSIGIMRDSRECYDIGENWRHNYEVKIKDGEKSEKIVCLGDGREIIFKKVIYNEFEPLMGGNEKLLYKNDNSLVYEKENSKFYFDVTGKLLYEIDDNNNRISFEYNDLNQLIKVETEIGSYLKFRYNGNGQIIEVNDHTGRSVLLNYQYGVLTSVTNPLGNVYQYEYDESGYLNRIITPRGICGLFNSYDSIGRTVQQVMPDQKTMKMQYDSNDKSNCCIERDGVLTKYEYDEKMRHIKTTDHEGEESFTYNDRNQKTMWKDKNGNVTYFTYDGNGNMSMIRNAINETFSFTYNEKNLLLEMKGPDRKRDIFVYDSNDHLQSISNSIGETISIHRNDFGKITQVVWQDQTRDNFFFDVKGNLLKWDTCIGSVQEFQYDNLNRVTAYYNTYGNVTSYEYDKMNHLIKVVNSLGDERKLEYNPSGMLVKFVDFDDSFIEWNYDDCNRIKEVKDKEGNIQKYSYDDMGRVNEVVYPNGGMNRYTYNHNGKIIHNKYSDMEGVSYEYDGNGNLVKEIIGSAENLYFYDALNRLTKVKLPNNREATYQYNVYGKVSRVVDTMGNELCYEYDSEARLIKENLREGGNRTYSYHCMGGYSSSKDTFERKTIYQYTSGGQLSSVLQPDGKIETLHYNKAGKIIEKKYSDGRVIKFDYDALERLNTIESNLNKTRHFQYDKVGNIVSVSNGEEIIASYTYSAGGRLIGVKDVYENGCNYCYDSSGNLTEINQYASVDASPFHIKFERNKNGLPISISDSKGNKESYSYSASGKLVEKRDKEGFVTHFSYSEDDVLSGIQYDDNKQTEFTYDKLNRLISMVDWNGETRINRDAAGRIISVTDHEGRRVEYFYGDHGEKTKMVYPNGTSVLYCYDELFRLKSINVGSDYIYYHYDQLGRLVEKTFSGGLQAKYSYNIQGMLLKLEYRDSYGVLESLEFQYDEMANKKEVKKYRKEVPGESGTYQYTYDKLNQLIEVRKEGISTEKYQYDGKGNQIYKVVGGQQYLYEYNQLNQMIRCEKIGKENKISEYQYDKRGNLKEERYGSHIKSYLFGVDNRLEKVVLWENEIAVTEMQYHYNGIGQRIGQTLIKDGEAKTTKYVNDFTKKTNHLLLKEENGHMAQYISDGHILGQITGGELQFLLHDELGSVLRMQWKTGKTESIYGYGSYGEDLYGNQGEKQPFGFTGYRFDPIVGTYYANAREYMGEHGRFISNDKLRYVNFVNNMSYNLYTYCMNNPVNYVDYKGNDIVYFYDPDTFDSELDTLGAASDLNYLVNELGYSLDEIHVNRVSSANQFIVKWNSMDDTEEIEAVIISSHAGPGAFQFGDKKNITKFHAKNFVDKSTPESVLEQKDIKVLISLGCNTGNELALAIDPSYDTSRWFIDLFLNELDIQYVVAASGNVNHSLAKENRFQAIDYSVPYRAPEDELAIITWFKRRNYEMTVKSYETNFKLFFKENNKIQNINMLKKYENIADIFKQFKYIELESFECK